jgi:hypothetical protein
MANQEHLAILKQGVDVWNTWREEHPEVWPALREADLSKSNLKKVDLSGAHLFRTNFSEADLRGANLQLAYPLRANLRGADLTEAVLDSANFIGADLRGANLTGANLRFANLQILYAHRFLKYILKIMIEGQGLIVLDGK